MGSDDAVKIAGTAHNFPYDSDDHICSVCGGVGLELPTDCPGMKMSDVMREAVALGRADFTRGAWQVVL